MTEPSTGDRIRGFFHTFLRQYVDWEGELLWKILDKLEGEMRPEPLARLRAGAIERRKRWQDLPFVPPAILEELDSAITSETLLAQFELILLDVAKAIATLQFGMAPAGIDAGYRAEREIETGRFDPATAAAMHHRGILTPGQYLENMADLGWGVGERAAWYDLIRERPGIGEYIRWSYRIQQDPEAARGEMLQRGMTPEDIAVLFELSSVIPGVGDLIRMAVREAFTPEAIAKYDLGARFPAELAKWTKKQGMSEEWAKRYWYAHWVLPSATAGFEMVHRDKISIDELRDLLIYADYAPGWIDKMIEISYRPITRVDIRRIYRDLPAGSIDIYRRHLDLGYNPEDAELMTTWVEKEYVADITEPLKSDILGAYGDDLITRAAALSMLIAVGTDPWAAEIALDRKDIAKARKLQAEVIRQAKTLYINGDYDRSQVHGSLGAINLPAIRISRLLEEWDVSKAGKVARPSVAKLEGYFFRDIIDRGTFVEHLSRHKYGEPYLTWAIRDIETRKMEALVKEEERAAKEAERVAKLEVKTAYEEARAAINYQIAQLKVHLLEIRLYIGRLAEWPERKEIVGIIEDAKVSIAGIQVEIQEKRANLTSQQTILRTLAVPADMEALYTMIDNAQIAITDEQAAISELRAVIIEAKGRIRQALPGAEVEDQRQVIDAILIDIASESVDIAKLRLIIAARKSELAEATTSEDLAALEEEMRVVQLAIARLEAERARLKL